MWALSFQLRPGGTTQTVKDVACACIIRARWLVPILYSYQAVLTETRCVGIVGRTDVSAIRDVFYIRCAARELLELNHEEEALKLKVSGYVSSVNFSAKKLTMLLFINHRLVESTGGTGYRDETVGRQSRRRNMGRVGVRKTT